MNHQHRTLNSEGPLPFTGSVARDQNRSAHGNVRWRYHCNCGAYRDELINGRHKEHGPWTQSEPDGTQETGER